MTEYISRDKAFKAIDNLDDASDAWGCAIPMSAIRDEIKAIPAADVRPVVKAEWVRCGDGENTPYMCSHCGKTSPANLVEKWTPNFCPNCGADMRGKSDV